MLPLLFLKTLPYPAWPRFPFEAPSKFILTNLYGERFPWDVEARGVVVGGFLREAILALRLRSWTFDSSNGITCQSLSSYGWARIISQTEVRTLFHSSSRGNAWSWKTLWLRSFQASRVRNPSKMFQALLTIGFWVIIVDHCSMVSLMELLLRLKRRKRSIRRVYRFFV